MKGAVNFLTFTSVDARFGGQTMVSVPLNQVRAIEERQFGGNVGNDHLKDVKSSIVMAGKDVFYWALETRAALVDQANGLK